MIEEDGNSTLEWFKKTYRDNDKYMSRLMCCEQVNLLNTLVYFIHCLFVLVYLYPYE